MRQPRYIVLVAVTVLFGGCATYHAAPLSKTYIRDAVSQPDSAAIQQAASNLRHPYLRPMSINLDDGLSQEEAAVLAVVANPELRAVRAEKGVATAQLIAAGVLPDPELAGSLDFPIHDSTKTTGTGADLSFDLSSLITRSSERAAARANLSRTALEIAWQEWQVAEATRRQVFDIVFLQRQVALAREEESALDKQRRALAVARAQKLVTETDRAAAETAYLQAHAERLDLSTRLDTTQLGLLRLLGFPPDAKVRVTSVGVPYADLPEPGKDESAQDFPARLDTSDVPLPLIPERDSLFAELERRRIDLVALRYGYESQDASLRAAILRQFPSISIGFSRATDTDAVLSVGPSLSVRLPFFDRNRGEIALARATREQLRQEYVARVSSSRSVVAVLLSQLESLRNQLLTAEAAVHARRKLVTSYGKALRLGDADVLTYYTAQTDLIGAEVAALQFRQSLASLTLALQTATGGIMTTP